ncbi:hypothetical protein BKA60DRAFT_560830 [Fusarium oxysporum]|nr:hypothetical protein BKA60DRAFT_560830 [Fusarium oxysporum]
MSISCEVHYLQYCASRISISYPSRLEELLEAYKGVWMKLQRRKLCNAAVNQPPTQGDMFYRQADGQGVPANNNLLPNNAVLGGFPRNPQPVGHFEPESNPIRRLFDPDAGDLVRTIADHRDQLNPFQAFLANQRNRAQSKVRSPFVTQPDPGPAQEPRMNVIEDREVISIESSDEGMLEDQPEQTHNVPQVAGGRPRKRKGQRGRGTEPETGNGSESSWPRRRESAAMGTTANLIHLRHKDRPEIKEELGLVLRISHSLIRSSILQLDREHGDNSMGGIAHFDTKDERSFSGLVMREVTATVVR